MHNEAIERAAEVLCCGGNRCEFRDGGRPYSECQAKFLKQKVKAVISAFLADTPVSEPSEEMLDIGGGAFMIFFKELKERGLNHDEEYDAARCAFSDAWKLMAAKLAEEIQ